MFHLIRVTSKRYIRVASCRDFEKAKDELFQTWRPGTTTIIRNGATGERINRMMIEKGYQPLSENQRKAA